MDNPVIEKIQKLLNLTKSSNPHEAALAAERAAELMAFHKLDAADLEIASGDSSKREGVTEQEFIKFGKFESKWRAVLANAVAKSFDCYVLLMHGSTCQNIIGRKSDIQAATYTYQYLLLEVERLCAQTHMHVRSGSPMTGAQSNSWKQSFRTGAVMEIAANLQYCKDMLDVIARETRSTAMVLVNNAREEVYQHVKSKYKVGQGPSVRQNSNSQAFHLGRKAGANIKLSADNALGKPAERLGT